MSPVGVTLKINHLQQCEWFFCVLFRTVFTVNSGACLNQCLNRSKLPPRGKRTIARRNQPSQQGEYVMVLYARKLGNTAPPPSKTESTSQSPFPRTDERLTKIPRRSIQHGPPLRLRGKGAKGQRARMGDRSDRLQAAPAGETDILPLKNKVSDK